MDFVEQNRLCCVSHWLPILEGAGLPVPRTELVRPEPDVEWPSLFQLCDGQQPDGWLGFFTRLTSAISRMKANTPGVPTVFLRTGQTSGKHDWRNTCCVESLENVTAHVTNLVEYSASCSLLGLPCDVFAVREMLPTEPIAFLPRYGGMPLVTEVRAFVAGGEVLCTHPYWPPDSILQGLYVNADKIDPRRDGLDTAIALASAIPMDEIKAVWELLTRAAGAFYEAGVRDGTAQRVWSVDILQTADPARPWVITDCALGDLSFHWPGCTAVRVKPTPEGGVAAPT